MYVYIYINIFIYTYAYIYIPTPHIFMIIYTYTHNIDRSFDPCRGAMSRTPVALNWWLPWAISSWNDTVPGTQWWFPWKWWCNAVDGRKPASVDRSFIPLSIGFQRSRMVQDFATIHCLDIMGILLEIWMWISWNIDDQWNSMARWWEIGISPSRNGNTMG